MIQQIKIIIKHRHTKIAFLLVVFMGSLYFFTNYQKLKAEDYTPYIYMTYTLNQIMHRLRSLPPQI